MKSLGRIIKRICHSTLGVAVAAVVIACLLGWSQQHQEMQEEIYIVRSGDTLSEIAEAYAPKDTAGGRDAGEMMQSIVENNAELQTSRIIHPGQQLKITYWVEK